MYDSQYYLNSSKKETISSLKGLKINYKIYYQNNPQEYYSLHFDKLSDDLTLTIVIDKNQDSENFDEYTLEKHDNYNIYRSYNDLQITTMGVKSNLKINIIVEFSSRKSREEINKFYQISKDMQNKMNLHYLGVQITRFTSFDNSKSSIVELKKFKVHVVFAQKYRRAVFYDNKRVEIEKYEENYVNEKFFYLPCFKIIPYHSVINNHT